MLKFREGEGLGRPSPMTGSPCVPYATPQERRVIQTGYGLPQHLLIEAAIWKGLPRGVDGRPTNQGLGVFDRETPFLSCII